MTGVRTAVGRRPELRACLAVFGAASILIAPGCLPLPRPPEAATPVEKRGRHLLRIAEGCSCHGMNFAGWRRGGPDQLPRSLPFGERFVGPFGTVPAPNITPDPETGIGRWSDAEITRALRDGGTPEGDRLHPIMPYAEYHGMAESDLAALVTYLRRLRPVRNQVPERQLAAPLEPPAPTTPGPPLPPGSGVELGRYLVHHVSGCVNCHTPAAADGAPSEMLLAGRVLEQGPRHSVVVPNITPDRETGIGRWSEGEIARYLRTGSRPDGGLAQSLMAGLIFTSFSHFTPAEGRAVAAYLKSVPPVRRRL